MQRSTCYYVLWTIIGVTTLMLIGGIVAMVLHEMVLGGFLLIFGIAGQLSHLGLQCESKPIRIESPIQVLVIADSKPPIPTRESPFSHARTIYSSASVDESHGVIYARDSVNSL
jgi:hypothetical protein